MKILQPTGVYLHSAMRLPIIDISPFLNAGKSQDKAEVALQLDNACRIFGAFYLTGHGIDTSKTISEMKSFFSLDATAKRKISVRPGGFLRGYIGMGEESGSDALEVKEAFSYGYPWPADILPKNSMQGPNVWPTHENIPVEWQHSMEDFFSRMTAVAQSLVRAFSLGYGYQEEYLHSFCRNGDTISVMRLFHYFPYKMADQQFPAYHDRIGSSAHTDWGFLTLILQQNGVTGLQFFHDGDWMDIPPVPDTLLVNCGDYFSLLTHGEYISPLHRVISEGVERTSGVFFFYPDYDARIPVLGKQQYSLLTNQKKSADSKIDPGETPFGEFIRKKWEQVQRKNT